ncbi:MFS transporter [Actinomadura fulvescens]|uniref:MFS transporter n=1 Tax=Actinomadura fulvescens TaxID=46160 RepID=UPI0031CE02B4
MSAPLRGNPPFRRYLLAGLISSAGTAMATGAVAFAVLRLGHGASGVAMVALGQTGATVLMLPVGGTLADRFSRVRVIVVAQLVIGSLVALQACLVAAERAQVAQLALIAAAVSVARAFSSPARFGLVGDLVPAEQAPEANSLAKLAQTGVDVFGPAVGGVVVAAAGPSVGIGVNALSFVLSALLMRGVRAPPARARGRTFRSDVREGWRVVSRTPWIAWKVLGSAVVVSCWQVSYAIAGLTYVQQRLGGPAAWGVVASCLGIGTVAGAVLALVWTPRRAGQAGGAALLPLALPGLCMGCGAPLPLIAGTVVFAAMGLTVAAVTWRSLVQQKIPESQQGRVAAWVQLGETGLAPLAFLLVDPAVGRLGLQGALLLCAGGLAAAAVAPLAHPDVRRLRLAPRPSQG